LKSLMIFRAGVRQQAAVARAELTGCWNATHTILSQM
jgi:hypothetical protein